MKLKNLTAAVMVLTLIHGMTAQTPSTATVTCPAACTVTVTATPVVTPPTPPTIYVGPCDVLASAGTPCIAATNLARKARAAYAGALYLTSTVGGNCTFTEFYDHMGTPTTGNNLTLDIAFGKQPAPCGTTTPPSGTTVSIARITPGEGYYQGACCNGGGTVGMPQGNVSITMYMVIENNSEGGAVNGCCSGYSDSESPTRGGTKGHMFGPSWAIGGMGTVGTGTGPWPGVDLEQGNWLYGPTPMQKYLTILAKYNATTGTLTLKSGDAAQGTLTTLYSGPLPPGYTGLSLEGGYSLGRGGDASSAPINFIEGAVIGAATTDAADNALQANIVGFYGAPQL
jgi:non-reducing end alpha-L-arabinofuranosidase